MAPSGRRRRTRSTATRKTRRTLFKKHREESENQEISGKNSSDNSLKKIDDEGDNNMESDCVEISTSGCSTPKGEKFRIPRINKCPPAPMKKSRPLVCSSLRRNPIAFFAPPDLELFFFFASDLCVDAVSSSF